MYFYPRKLFPLTGLCLLLFGCQSSVSLITPSQHIAPIKGKVTWPESKLKTKATFAALIDKSTVYLINPANFSTIVSGITAADGSFNLLFDNVTPPFAPPIDSTWILEAGKRIGNATTDIGKNSMYQRTVLQWKASGEWYSITNTNSIDPILVNPLTTAISVIQGMSYGTVPSADTIGKIVGGVPQDLNVVEGFTAAYINNIKTDVENYLTQDVDPIAGIYGVKAPSITSISAIPEVGQDYTFTITGNNFDTTTPANNVVEIGSITATIDTVPNLTTINAHVIGGINKMSPLKVTVKPRGAVYLNSLLIPRFDDYISANANSQGTGIVWTNGPASISSTTSVNPGGRGVYLSYGGMISDFSNNRLFITSTAWGNGWDSYCVNLNDLTTDVWQWNAPNNKYPYGTPALSPDKSTLYFVDNGFYYSSYGSTALFAVDASDGNTVLWSYTIDFIPGSGNEPLSPAVGLNGIIYTAGADYNGYGTVYAFNPNGSLKWQRIIPGSDLSQPNNYVWSPIIGTNGEVYVFDNNGSNLYALNAETGADVWGAPFTFDNQLDSPPVIGRDGTVYVSCWNNIFGGRTVYAIDPATGVQKVGWTLTNLGGNSITNMVLGVEPDNNIYVFLDNSYIYKVNGSTGLLEWGGTFYDYSASGSGTYSPVVDKNGRIYFGSGSYIYGINPNKTEVFAPYDTGSGGSFEYYPFILAGDGKIYANDGNSSQTIYVIE